jgi:twitching motility protein PilU
MMKRGLVVVIGGNRTGQVDDARRDVGVDTESWFSALKNALRQAPDVILIGEIRDRQTMEYAIEFSETGHLCMATLHANNANQALDRSQLLP